MSLTVLANMSDQSWRLCVDDKTNVVHTVSVRSCPYLYGRNHVSPSWARIYEAPTCFWCVAVFMTDDDHYAKAGP